MDKKNKIEAPVHVKTFRGITGILLFSFILLIIFISSTALFAYSTNLEVWHDSNLIRTVQAPLALMAEQVSGYDSILTGEVHWALLDAINNETEEVEERKETYDEIGLELDNILKIEAPALIEISERSDEEKKQVLDIIAKLNEINSALVDLELRAFDAIEKGDIETAFSLVCEGDYYVYKAQLKDYYAQWAAIEAGRANFYRLRTLEHNIQVRYANLALAIILTLTSIIIPILVFYKMIKPINKLASVAHDISSGDLNVKIPANLKENKNEIGEMANAFDKLLESSHFALKTLVDSKMAENERYESFFHNSVDAIIIADSKTRKLIYCNKAAEKLLGYSKKEILSMKADEIHPKDKVKETMDGFRKQAEGKLKVIFTEVLTKDNRRIPVKINASAILIKGKTYSQGIFRVLSEENKSQNY